MLLSTSDPTGVAYIQTINLDGESNLKTRYAKQETISRTNEDGNINGVIRCEKPNRNIYMVSWLLWRLIRSVCH